MSLQEPPALKYQFRLHRGIPIRSIRRLPFRTRSVTNDARTCGGDGVPNRSVSSPDVGSTPVAARFAIVENQSPGTIGPNLATPARLAAETV